MTAFQVGDTVRTKKPHACGGNTWQVVRVGADYKLKCAKCGHVVLLDRAAFLKAVRNPDRATGDKS